jgi:Holliday junction resolvase RusA-like endonuclease
MPYTPYASENKMYGRDKKGRTFLRPEARAWRKALTEKVQAWLKNYDISFPECGQVIQIHLTAHFPPRGGKGKGRKPDPPNFLKLPLDGISSALKIDDYSFEVEARIGAEDPKGYLVYRIEI